MSTIKVQVPGSGGADADAGSITQKKTIRVKRPTMPAAADLAADGAAASGDPSAIPALEPVLMAPARERAVGAFVAVAFVAIGVAICLLLVFSSQVFGPKAKVYLGGHEGPEFAPPGAVNVGI